MKRNRIEQVIDVLKACVEPKITTHIMYKVGMNYGIVKQVLKYCEDQILIKTIIADTKPKKNNHFTIKMSGMSTTRTFYKTTDKGRRLIIDYDDLILMLGMK